MYSFHWKKVIFLIFFVSSGIVFTLAQPVGPQEKPWDADPKAYVQTKAVQASADQTEIQDSLNIENLKLENLEITLNRTVQAPKIAALRAEIKQSKLKIKKLQANLTEKIQEGKMYKEMSYLTEQEIRVRLKNSHLASNIKHGKKEPMSPPITKDPELSSTSVKTDPKPEEKIIDANPAPVITGNEKIASQSFEPWNTKDHSEILVKQDCQFQESTTSSNQKSGAALLPEVLFKYTPEELKKYLRGQNYVTGAAFIATEPGYTYLQLRLEIASDQALRHYGNLEKSILTVYFVNGKEVKIVNSRFDAGYVDNLHKTTTMTGVYFLEKPMLKMLSSSEVDKVRLNFTTGYEDYVVYNIDFFTRQLACINASK